MVQSERAVVWLKVAGAALIWGAIGVWAGYWLGDWGFRWFPNTVDILLICLFAGLSCLLGANVKGGVMRENGKWKRLKKSVMALCVLFAAAAAIHLAGCQFGQQAALTRLPADAFEAMIAADTEQLAGYDREMECALKQMESHAVFTTGADAALSAEDETFLRQAWLSLYDYAFAVDQIRQSYADWWRFDVGRKQRPYHVQSYLVQFGADVILYEKAMRIIETVKRNPSAVKFLNAPHAGSEIGAESFSRFQLDLFGADCGTRLNAGRVYLEWLDKGLAAHSVMYAGACMPLWADVEAKLAVLDRMGLLAHAGAVADADMELVRQGLYRVWFPAQKGVAKWMGDTRVRRAGKYLVGPELQAELNTRLEPGDVLLSRKNWYMSNVGLPGFWPHAILYIGEPAKLTAYFDDASVLEYLKSQSGHDVSFEQYMSEKFGRLWQRYMAGTGQSDYHVIEAVKYGVLLNPLSKACGDYMVGLRPKLDKVAKAQAIIEAFSHLDKPYDFDFDFATDDVLVCTELVWRSYRPGEDKQGLTFTLSDMAGRKTLPANEMARQYRNAKQNGDSQFDFVCFIEASEKELNAHFADEAAFLESVDRPKWSFVQP